MLLTGLFYDIRQVIVCNGEVKEVLVSNPVDKVKSIFYQMLGVNSN